MTKRGFTLVELLVVMGIIAAMATVSIGSYFGVVRGMSDRGALAAATSVISLARDRARIDCVPTVVYFYNEVIQHKDAARGNDMVVAGVAVAVRRAGRITRKNGNLLDDEFADLDRTYGVAESQNSDSGDTFRLYRFNFRKMEYSSVFSEAVDDSYKDDDELFLVERPVKRDFRREDGELEGQSEIPSYAFKIKPGEGNANWEVGDAYGYEFARVRLPDNYIFEGDSSMPTAADPIIEIDTKTIKCYPDSTSSSLESIGVYGKRPNRWELIGKTMDEMKDI